MKKIMQCLMGLDIGGAETHVVELSKSLVAQGYEVVVASNGGLYESELKKAGVGVLNIPMHTKNPFYALKSLIALHQEIKRFKPDIVHAHARIPALYVSIMKTFHNFKMMTTVHGNFKVNWLLKRLTQWGEDIFVVSEDIETYLTAHYRLKGEIHRTINGIDTSRFHTVQRNLPYKRLVHVSRLEHNTSKMAHALIEIADRIDLEIIIVGGGSELDSLKKKAQGLSNVTFTGPVDNVPERLEKGDLFVGISRAALEAMSMDLPLILGGEYGYMGILTQDKIDLAIRTNFTARVPEQLTRENLLKDIRALLGMAPDSFSWMRPFIESNYSVPKMVNDYKDIYEKSNRVLVIGYYGSDNLGDELLLKEALDLMSPYARPSKISVLSYHVDQTQAMHGVKGISRNKFFSIVKAILKADLIVGGGGSMLQNVTSNRSLIYYLSLIRLGKIFGKKVWILGNGIGPVHGKFQTAMVKKALMKVDLLHLRDQESYNWIDGDAHAHIMLGLDLALLSDTEQVAKKKKVLINLRKWPKVDHVIAALMPLKERLENAGYEISLVSMQWGNDNIPLGKLGPVRRLETLEDLEDEVASASFAIGMRLHTLILCANYDVPFLGLSYDPKVKAFCIQSGMPYLEDFENLTEQQMIQGFETLIAGEDTYRSSLRTQRVTASEVHEKLKEALSRQIQA